MATPPPPPPQLHSPESQIPPPSSQQQQQHQEIQEEEAKEAGRREHQRAQPRLTAVIDQQGTKHLVPTAVLDAFVAEYDLFRGRRAEDLPPDCFVHTHAATGARRSIPVLHFARFLAAFPPLPPPTQQQQQQRPLSPRGRRHCDNDDNNHNDGRPPWLDPFPAHGTSTLPPEHAPWPWPWPPPSEPPPQQPYAPPAPHTARSATTAQGKNSYHHHHPSPITTGGGGGPQIPAPDRSHPEPMPRPPSWYDYHTAWPAGAPRPNHLPPYQGPPPPFAATPASRTETYPNPVPPPAGMYNHDYHNHHPHYLTPPPPPPPASNSNHNPLHPHYPGTWGGGVVPPAPPYMAPPPPPPSSSSMSMPLSRAYQPGDGSRPWWRPGSVGHDAALMSGGGGRQQALIVPSSGGPHGDQEIQYKNELADLVRRVACLPPDIGIEYNHQSPTPTAPAPAVPFPPGPTAAAPMMQCQSQVVNRQVFQTVNNNYYTPRRGRGPGREGNEEEEEEWEGDLGRC